MAKTIGIDLGSMSARAGFWDGQEVRNFSLELLTFPMPIIVDKRQNLRSFDPKDSQYPFGRFSSFKQNLGIGTILKNHQYSGKVVDQLAIFFTWIKARLEGELGEEISGVILAVNSCFMDQEKFAVQSSLLRAGFKTVKLLDETLAAVLGVGLKGEQSVLVYDLGETTFSTALFQLKEDSPPSMLANGGNIYMGGNCFDDIVAADFYRQLITSLPQENTFFSESLIRTVKIEAEGLRKELSSLESSSRIIEHSNATANLSLSRKELEEKVEHIVEASFEIVKQMLMDKKVDTGQINTVLLSGQVANMPLIQTRFKEKFPQAIIRIDYDAVVRGASIFIGQLKEKEPQHVKEDQTVFIFSNETMAVLPQADRKEEKAPKGVIGDLTRLLAEGMGLWNNGRRPEAIDHLEKYLKESCDFISICMATLAQQIESKDIDMALSYYEKARSLTDDKQLLQKYSHAYGLKSKDSLKKNDIQRAKAYAKAGREIYEDCPLCCEILKRIKEKERQGQLFLPKKHRRNK